MANETSKETKGAEGGQAQKRRTGTPINVAFPQSGPQDCFPATRGTPFIANGLLPNDGRRIVGARLIIGTSQPIQGTLFERADFLPDDDDEHVLELYGTHKILADSSSDYGADTMWAVAFPGIDSLPEDVPVILIVRAASFDQFSETIVAFTHHVPK